MISIQFKVINVYIYILTGNYDLQNDFNLKQVRLLVYWFNGPKMV